MSVVDHLALTPNETPVEYLKRLVRSLETEGCYTIEKMAVRIYPSLNSGSVAISWDATPSLIATAAKQDEEE